MKAAVREKEFVRLRQRIAPLRREREQYLAHLLNQGTSRRYVRVVAARLLDINRLLGLTTLRSVSTAELEVAARKWVAQIESHPTRVVGPSTAYTLRIQPKSGSVFITYLSLPRRPPPFRRRILRVHVFRQSHATDVGRFNPQSRRKSIAVSRVGKETPRRLLEDFTYRRRPVSG
jgi:hypothetical protein